jgi:hypothetical protein
MNVEHDKTLPFPDCFIKKRKNDTLGHSVYRKPMHVVSSNMPNLHITQHRSYLSLFVYCASSICDVDSREEEIEHLEKNGCSNQDIRQALKEVLNIELVVSVYI